MKFLRWLCLAVLVTDAAYFVWTHRQRLGITKPHVTLVSIGPGKFTVHIDRLEPGMDVKIGDIRPCEEEHPVIKC